MITLQVVDARKRFLIAAALRLFTLTTSYCRLDVGSRAAILSRDRASNDRFRLVVELVKNLTDWLFFDSEIAAEFLKTRCAELLMKGERPDDSARFFPWLASLDDIIEGNAGSPFVDLWFCDFIEYLGPEDFWCSGDELALLIESSLYVDTKNAVETKNWLARRPDLTVQPFTQIPPCLYAAESFEHDHRRQMLSNQVDSIRQSVSNYSKSERTPEHVWADVVLAVNVGFLNDLLDLCDDDHIKPLESDVNQLHQLLPTLREFVHPDICDGVVRRLKNCSTQAA